MNITTTILISNLHCSSCVNTIRDALSALIPEPSSITTSIVSQSVTVEHDSALTKESISLALDDAGFDLVSTPQLEGYRIQRSASYFADLLSKKQQKHAAQCLLCQRSGSATHAASHGASCHPDDTCVADEKIKLEEVPSRIAYLDLNATGSRLSKSYQAPDAERYNASFSVSGMSCVSCVNAVTRAAKEIPGVSNVAVSLIGNSATATLSCKSLVGPLVEAIEDGGYSCELISIEPELPTSHTNPTVTAERMSHAHDGPRPLSATFSIDGMTCASCVGNVVNATSEIEGVSNVAVNLVGKSASATFANRDLLNAFIEAVEDGGYGAELVDVETLNGDGDDDHDPHGPRTVNLRVDGMFCQHCPPKIRKALQVFEDRIVVESCFDSWNDPKPIITISYTPSAPEFTIRDIISTLADSNKPPFNVTLAKPPSLEERARLMHAREQRNLLTRLLSAVVLAIPTFIIGIVYMSLLPSTNRTRMWFMSPLWAGNVSRAVWALFIMATPAMFYSASQFHRRSIKELYGLWRPGSRTPILRRFIRFGSMNLLVSFGVSIAYFASIALLALAAVQAPSSSGEGDSTTYFDSVVFLTMFLLAGRYLEAYSKGRTADAVTALGKLRPTEALVLVPEHSTTVTPFESATDVNVDLEKGIDDDLKTEKPGLRVQKINADWLEIGDIVRVPHGATPPTDGVIVSRDGGQFDESSLTGESRHISKKKGDQVFVGTINRGSSVDVKVTALGGETMLDKIVKVVREGQTKRAPIEKLADVITGYFVPVITLLAILTWVIWLSLGFSGVLPPSYLDIPIGGWAVWALEFAIAVFVVACPCGVGLAAPTALLVGSGLAAKYGILVRGGGEAFQEAAQLDIIVFDKTGTLTEGGEPKVTDSELSFDGTQWNREIVLSVAHALESASSHPLALALRSFCEAQDDIKLVAREEDGIEEVGGRGLKGQLSSPACEAVIGNEKWMEEHGAKLTIDQERLITNWQCEGKSVIALAMRELSPESPSFSVVAVFAVADKLRSEARDVVLALQDQGLGTWMISGDNPTTAKAVAKSVGIPERKVIAGVLPHQKAEKIVWLQQTGTKREAASWRKLLGIKRLNERAIVAMVGDGINDAPALSAADVGIAVGSGSDVAISSASFILIKSNLCSLLTLTDLSRRVFNRVKFNFFWAVVYNSVALPIAAGVIYPAHHARLNPVWASLAMALSSVSVVLSSLLLRLYREPKAGRNSDK